MNSAIDSYHIGITFVISHRHIIIFYTTVTVRFFFFFWMKVSEGRMLYKLYKTLNWNEVRYKLTSVRSTPQEMFHSFLLLSLFIFNFFLYCLSQRIIVFVILLTPKIFCSRLLAAEKSRRADRMNEERLRVRKSLARPAARACAVFLPRPSWVPRIRAFAK